MACDVTRRDNDDDSSHNNPRLLRSATLLFNDPTDCVRMSDSLANFPAEVIEQILLFAPSPRAVTRVGGTCSTLHELVTTNERIWNSLYKRRWIIMRESSQLVYSRQDYVDRHGQDARNNPAPRSRCKSCRNGTRLWLGSRVQNANMDGTD